MANQISNPGPHLGSHLSSWAVLLGRLHPGAPHSSERGLAQSQARTLGWQLWTGSPGCTGNQRFYGNLAGAGQRAIRHPEEQLLKIARPMPDFGCPPGGRDDNGAHPARPAGGSPSFPLCSAHS